MGRQNGITMLKYINCTSCTQQLPFPNPNAIPNMLKTNLCPNSNAPLIYHLILTPSHPSPPQPYTSPQ